MQLNRRTVITINGRDITSRITSGTIRISEMIANEEFRFGELCIDMFECQVYGFDNDVSGQEIFVNCIENPDPGILAVNDGRLAVSDGNLGLSRGASTRLFTGVIDSCKRDYTNTYRDIVAYNFTKRDYDVTSWWNLFWDGKSVATLKEIRQSLNTYLGITEINKVLPNDSLEINSSGLSVNGITYEYVIRCIGELQRCFPHINRDGLMEYITLGDNTHTLDGLYEKNRSEWKDVNAEKVTGVAVYSTSDDCVQSYGSMTNPYVISGNMFLLNMTAEALNILLSNFYNGIKDITYTPCELNMIVSDLSIKLGDQISYDGKTSYVFENTLTGVQYVDQELRAGGDQYRSKEVESASDMIIEGSKFLRIEKNIDSLVIEIGSVEENLEDNYYTKTETNTQITNSADGVKVYVSEHYTTQETTAEVKSNAIKTDFTHHLATSLSSGVTKNTPGWDIDTTLTATNKYLWVYHTYTYGDNHTSDTVPIIDGVYGDKGDPGTAVTVSGIEYAASTSGTTAPSSGWSTIIPTVAQGSFLWTKTLYSDNTVAYTASRQGNDGTGVSISSQEVKYQTSESGTTVPTGEWSQTVPSVSQGEYLWTRTVVTYSDGVSTTGYSVARNGVDGATGATGTGISSLVTLYYSNDVHLAPNAPTSEVTTDQASVQGAWTKAVPKLDDIYRYMYRCDQVYYDDNTITWTEPVEDLSITTLTQRMSYAEQQITPEAITQTVSRTFVSKEEFNNLSVGGENLIHESDTYDYEGKYFFVAGLKLSGRNGVLKLRKSATDEKTLTMKVGGY